MKEKLKVFSFFCGAGGSTAGYKKAGLDVIEGCDVDKNQVKIYKKQHNPKFFIEEDCRKVLENDYDFLYNLDIIDGSPPCTNFSVANTDRKSKQLKTRSYAEGKINQTLEDLVLIYFKIVVKYKPKFFIFENVVNLNTQYKSYLNQCLTDSKIFDSYNIVKFYLNPCNLGGYTDRERFFILGIKKNEEFKVVKYRPINKSPLDIKELSYFLDKNTSYQIKIWEKLKKDIKHFENKLIDFTTYIPVITTQNKFFNFEEPYLLHPKFLAFVQGFGDYNWNNVSNSRIMYAIGMSVHPLCTEYIGKFLIDFEEIKEIPVILDETNNLDLFLQESDSYDD